MGLMTGRKNECVALLKQHGPWALDRLPDFLSHGEDVYQQM